MAKNEINLGDQTSNIAEQIGRLLPAMYGSQEQHSEDVALPEDVALLESFELWEIAIQDLEAAIATREFPAQQTKYLHHQIRIGEGAKAFAMSQKSGSGLQYVYKLAVSDIAEKIHEAIDFLDHRVADDTMVRLLVVQACSIYAFWLVDYEEVYVISVPTHFRERIRSGQYFSNQCFLGAIYKAVLKFLSKGGYDNEEFIMPW